MPKTAAWVHACPRRARARTESLAAGRAQMYSLVSPNPLRNRMHRLLLECGF